MKVIRLPKFLRAVPGIILSGLLFVLLMLVAAPTAQAANCVSVNVVVLGQTVAACVPTSNLPTITLTPPQIDITRTVTLPRRTVTVTQPRQTVRVPGPVRTVTQTQTQRIPGPVSTVTVNKTVAGKTVTQTAPTGQNGRESGTVVPTTTATSVKTKVVERDNLVKVTPPQAVGLSLGFIAVGILLALLALYIANRLGYMQSEKENVEDLQELRDSLK